MLHAGVLMKLGGYGCLRVAMFLCPEGCQNWMPFFLVLITINVAYGAFGALKQTDLKYVTAVTYLRSVCFKAPKAPYATLMVMSTKKNGIQF